MKKFSKDTRQLAKDMLKEFKKRGWAKGKNETSDGRVCLQGAYGAAVGGNIRMAALPDSFESVVSSVIRELHPRAVNQPVRFNDKSKSFDRVKNVLKFIVDAGK